MALRSSVKTTYTIERTLQPIYSGGSVALSEDGKVLAACLGEDVQLTDLSNGRELARVEGDGEVITALCSMHVPRVSSSPAYPCSDTIWFAFGYMLAISFHAHICFVAIRIK
jgi:WD40 repeat protein